MGIWGEAELFLGICGGKENTFREKRTLFAGRRGDQCINFQGSREHRPPLGASLFENDTNKIYQTGLILKYHHCRLVSMNEGLDGGGGGGGGGLVFTIH